MMAILAILGVVLLLLGVHYYTERFTLRDKEISSLDDSLMNLFRTQISEKPEVISKYNIFRQFLSKEDDSSYEKHFNKVKEVSSTKK